jgi:hypothetical protein
MEKRKKTFAGTRQCFSGMKNWLVCESNSMHVPAYGVGHTLIDWSERQALKTIARLINGFARLLCHAKSSHTSRKPSTAVRFTVETWDFRKLQERLIPTGESFISVKAIDQNLPKSSNVDKPNSNTLTKARKRP